MFLTTFVAVGVLGFAMLCLLFIYGFYQSISHRHTLLFCFLSVSLLTMLVEDSLETQTGISFFTFFLALFLSDCVGKGRLKFD
jgi:membrane-associated HD superfamily phosphohydrolase